MAIKPGGVIAANAGILLSHVLYTKQSGEKRLLIQHAAMNDVIRRAIHEVYRQMWPVVLPASVAVPPSDLAAIPPKAPNPGMLSPRM